MVESWKVKVALVHVQTEVLWTLWVDAVSRWKNFTQFPATTHKSAPMQNCPIIPFNSTCRVS